MKTLALMSCVLLLTGCAWLSEAIAPDGGTRADIIAEEATRTVHQVSPFLPQPWGTVAEVLGTAAAAVLVAFAGKKTYTKIKDAPKGSMLG